MNSESLPTRRTVIKGIAGSLAISALGESKMATANPASISASRLPRTSPESVGIESAGIQKFLEAVNTKVGGLHGFLLLRHGKVAAEGWWTPYAPQYPHMLYSLSKSFTSTAVGLAIEEGKFTLESPVTSFFPKELPSKVGANLAAMRVEHLLMMSTGHDKDATGPTREDKDGDWVKGFLSLPVEHAPGSKFVYNSAATYLLSAIVQKTVGKTVLEYLTPRLLTPLGIEGATWEVCPKGINTGGWGLAIKTEDIAKFGQTYLQKGVWNGQRVIPATWIEKATAKHISNGDPANASDWSQGYGYQFWRCLHGNYRGDGAFGQYCVVMPEQDAVLAITSGVGDMQAVLMAAWEHLLPAMKSEPFSTKPTVDLNKTIKALAVPVLEGKPTSSIAPRVSGKTFTFEENEGKVQSLTLTFSEERLAIKLRDARGEHKAEGHLGDWAKGKTTLIPGLDENTAIRGIWTSEDTLALQICLYKTPYLMTFTLHFEEDKLTFARKYNVSFGSSTLPVLVGHSSA